MTAENSTSRRQTVEFVLVAVAVLLSFGLLFALIPPAVLIVCGAIGLAGGVISLIPALVTRGAHGSRLAWLGPLSIALVVAVPFGFVVWFIYVDQGVISPTSALMVSALALVFYYYAFMLPLALLDVRRGESPSLEAPYPSISVVVPAYNEERCIGASLDALGRIEYPGSWEVVLVDDGSADRTVEVAREHAWSSVRILTKPNGGKHSALNYGLEHSGGEIVVTVDADSLLATDSLRRIATVFQDDPDVDAVAGMLSVANRGSFITNLQELEYVVGLQLFRRAYDFVEAVTLVPGALGAYRRSALEEVGGFDGDTLTEDFDATVQLLKRGSETRSVDSVCRTEAPDTWRDLYKQRLRWDRGHTQTLLKHRDVFLEPKYGFLQAIAFPIVLLSLTLVPVAGMVILASIVIELVIGSPMRVLYFGLFFTLVQSLVSVLAIRLQGTDPRLALYAPLFVIGYRQFLDVVMLKSVLDVLLDRDFGWTSVSRTGTLHAALGDDTGDDDEASEHP